MIEVGGVELETKVAEVNGKKLKYIDLSEFNAGEWQAYRSATSAAGYIGGSDVGTICGVNKFKDALMLFYEKIGLKENTFKGNDFTVLGSNLEAAILNLTQYGDTLEEVRLQQAKGEKIREAHDPFCTYFPDDMPYAALNIDGLVTWDRENNYLGTGIGEIKKLSGRVSEMYIGGVPPAHIFQLQYYMYGLKAVWGYVGVLAGEHKYYVRPFELDEEIVSMILDKVPRFVDAVKLGKEVMASKKSYPDKMQEIYMIEDTFADVLLSGVNWDLLGEFLVEPEQIDLRKGEIAIDSEMENWIVQADHYSTLEAESKFNKQKFHSKIKKRMTEAGAKVAASEDYTVKFNKRLSIRTND